MNITAGRGDKFRIGLRFVPAIRVTSPRVAVVVHQLCFDASGDGAVVFDEIQREGLEDDRSSREAPFSARSDLVCARDGNGSLGGCRVMPWRRGNVVRGDSRRQLMLGC